MSVPGQIGDYKIEALLGEGGMAAVYRGRHAVLDTQHAIKVLDPSLRSVPEARQRFLDEAKLQAKHLNHPNIVKVTNIVATADYAALVMELVDGQSLDELVGKLHDQPVEVKRIMLGILDAVQHAHHNGVIHRDLKPANVLMAREGNHIVPKVTDFGIAKLTTDGAKGSRNSTRGDARMGTLQYMSPEQVRGAKHVTPQSDIFSLGAILYELATGHLPFDAESDFDVMRNIVDGTYVPPEQRNPSIDPQIADVIKTALSPKPEARFQTCGEMAKALVEPRRVPRPPLPPPPVALEDDDEDLAQARDNRIKVIAMLAAGFALAAIVIALGVTAMRRQAQAADPRPTSGTSITTPVAAPTPTIVPTAPAPVQPPEPPPPPRPLPKPRPPQPTTTTNLPAGSGCDEVSCVLDNYAQPCCRIYKNAGGGSGGGGAVRTKPQSLDRPMISAGVGSVQSRIKRCGDLYPVEGTVKATVRVGADGRVTAVLITDTPDRDLGDCVESGLRSARFAATQSGGSFAIPFRFSGELIPLPF